MRVSCVKRWATGKVPQISSGYSATGNVFESALLLHRLLHRFEDLSELTLYYISAGLANSNIPLKGGCSSRKERMRVAAFRSKGVTEHRKGFGDDKINQYSIMKYRS